jgi:hypothetical protein
MEERRSPEPEGVGSTPTGRTNLLHDLAMMKAESFAVYARDAMIVLDALLTKESGWDHARLAAAKSAIQSDSWTADAAWYKAVFQDAVGWACKPPPFP